MMCFDDYAQYYDHFYKDKNYEGEAAYICNLIKTFGTTPHSLVELGCGTGLHAKIFAEKFGYLVHGVDFSDEMIKLAKLKSKQSHQVSFDVGDIRNYRINQKFDVCLSLFHVMSYQIKNSDFIKAATTAFSHLQKGGLFIFDFWYGPAVMHTRPETRLKVFKSPGVITRRFAEPTLFENENRVDVKYTFLTTKESSSLVEEFSEIHSMRYFFIPELEYFLDQVGFEILHFEDWMTGNEPSLNTWGVCCICRKK